jgi:hypothetical protein
VPRNDDSLERLRAAIDELAAADAADLLAEARIEARARVRATLTDALAHSMLEQLREQLPAVRQSSVPVPVPAPSRRRETQAEPCWYVYGVVGADSGAALELGESLPGVDSARAVTVLREGALAAVTSEVPLEEFEEERLREHLADMAWVEATARAHEAVLERVADQMTVIPMRMCTVYRTADGIRELLEREAEPLQDALDRLDGKSEWGVKVFADLAGATSTTRHQAAEAGDSPGAAYMERKRTERERLERAIELAETAATQIHERLSVLASDAQVIPLQRPEASGHAGDMVLNGVYLVSDDGAHAFHEEVHALQSELEAGGIELVATGPWPAYNFVPGEIGAAW